jgi:Ca2+-binding EF-hand superfamily protein
MGNRASKGVVEKTHRPSTSSQREPDVLDETAIDLIAHNTGFSRGKVLEWYTKFMCDYPSGHINRDEFIKSFKGLYTFGHPDKMATFAFTLFDKDQNGELSFREFLISTAFLTFNNMPDHKRRSLELAFLMFDRDENGLIDSEEILHLFNALYASQKHGHQRAKLEVRRIFENYDLDNSATLDKSEFINALSKENILDVLMNEN